MLFSQIDGTEFVAISKSGMYPPLLLSFQRAKSAPRSWTFSRAFGNPENESNAALS